MSQINKVMLFSPYPRCGWIHSTQRSPRSLGEEISIYNAILLSIGLRGLQEFKNWFACFVVLLSHCFIRILPGFTHSTASLIPKDQVMTRGAEVVPDEWQNHTKQPFPLYKSYLWQWQSFWHFVQTKHTEGAHITSVLNKSAVHLG